MRVSDSAGRGNLLYFWKASNCFETVLLNFQIGESRGQSYNLQFETPGLPRLPRLWDSQDSGTPKTPKTPGLPRLPRLRDSQDSGTPGRLMEKVKATSRKFHSSPNHFQVQIQA